MDPSALIKGWQERLLRLAADPPYVYVNTSQDLIERHQRRLTTFTGYPSAEVAAAEARLGLRFPEVYRWFLVAMGRNPGDLFLGSDLAELTALQEFRGRAQVLLSDAQAPHGLPTEAIVFLFHKGYSFLYLLADGGFDAAVWSWTEGDLEPELGAATFAGLVDAELELMEDNARRAHEQGGYYLTLHPGGGAVQILPALGSGERPLDRRPPRH